MTGDTSNGHSGPFERFCEMLENRVRANRVDLPPPPHLASELVMLSMRDDVAMEQIEAPLRRDQFLAGKLVSMANSSFYMRGAYPTANLRTAILRIGLRGVRDLAMVHVVATRVFTSRAHAPFLKEVWRRSLAVAVVAEGLSRDGRVGRGREYAFLAGLLHDIGVPVVVRAYEDAPLDVAPPATLEEVVDRLHARVGGFIARRWNLPDPLGPIIEQHHEGGDPGRWGFELSLIRCSSALAGALDGTGSAKTREPPEAAFGLLAPHIGAERVSGLSDEWPDLKRTFSAAFHAIG